MSSAEGTISKASHPSLSLAYDLALKTYDYNDRRYDLLGTRAAALIGFNSILVSGVGSLVPRLRSYNYGLALTAAGIFLSLLGYLIYHAVQAYRGREVKALPDPGVVFSKCAHLEEDDFRVEMTGQITDACREYSAACAFRSQHLRKGLYAFAIACAILLPALVLVP